MRQGGGHRRAAALTAALLALGGAAAPAGAQQAPPPSGDPGGFRNVLAVGQGETDNLLEFAQYQLSREPPRTFVNQRPLYVDLLYATPSLQPADLDRYFKPARFGVPPGEVESVESPRPGVTIVRDRAYHVPHVFGDTRSDTMFGAGYASAQDRLFFMDVLRHTGRARLTELIGPGEDESTVKMDAAQLKVADYSEEELQRMIDTAAAGAEAEGAQIEQDLLDYVEGINAYIAEARTDVSKLPAEYPLLGKTPRDWLPTDTVAVATLIGGEFGRGGGEETQAGLALKEAHARFGSFAEGREVLDDFWRPDDAEAPVTITERFPWPDPGRARPAARAIPDAGSFKARDPVFSRGNTSAQPGSDPPADRQTPPAAAAQGWVERLRRHGILGSGEHSNALLVGARDSESGRPIAVMGPQVGYWSPMILMEMDLHGPGIDARGATFPGISLYVLLGRGRDFAWSATTATTDVVDDFAERLCEPDGSRPTLESTHYVYNGRCVPLLRRRHVLRWTPGPADLAADPTSRPQTWTLLAERSVHGPIQGRATVGGAPVAIAESRSTYMHELQSALALKRLNSNEVTDARSFQRAMAEVNFAFNWYYVDRRDIAFLNSGWYPLRARGTDPVLPTWGTGRWDWQGFDPATFTSERIPFEGLPKAINPRRGWIVNWNNKQAPGWRASDSQWSYSSVHRSERLSDRVRRELRGSRKLDLTGLTQVMEVAATVDVRGQELYPWLRRVIGPSDDPRVRELLGLLDAWHRAGSHRRDMDRDNVYEHSGAVALMDAWWDPLVRRVFEPVLGVPLVERLRDIFPFDSPPNDGNGSSYGSGWYGQLEKDLRRVLGRRVRDRLSRLYCGRGSLERCREIVTGSLLGAAERARELHGVSDLSRVRIPATCPEDQRCDQIVFTTAGAVALPPIPWQDRPGFQQVVEVGGG